MSQMLHAEGAMSDNAGNFKDLPVTGSAVSTFLEREPNVVTRNETINKIEMVNV